MRSVTYDYEPNRNLMTIVDNQVRASSVSKYTCHYQGLRVEKKVEFFNGTEWTIDSHQRFIYDGWNLIATFDASSLPLSLQSTYLSGLDLSGSMQGAGGVGGLLSETDHTSPLTTFYPLFDANGNVSEYLDESGAIEAHYEYSPFGRLIASTGIADAFAFRFSTKYQDNETNLLYYGFRYFDPQTGRWLSRDPIGERGGLNLYGFAGNDPVGRWDVLGLDWDTQGNLTREEAAKLACAVSGWIEHAPTVAAIGSLVSSYLFRPLTVNFLRHYMMMGEDPPGTPQSVPYQYLTRSVAFQMAERSAIQHFKSGQSADFTRVVNFSSGDLSTSIGDTVFTYQILQANQLDRFIERGIGPREGLYIKARLVDEKYEFTDTKETENVSAPLTGLSTISFLRACCYEGPDDVPDRWMGDLERYGFAKSFRVFSSWITRVK